MTEPTLEEIWKEQPWIDIQPISSVAYYVAKARLEERKRIKKSNSTISKKQLMSTLRAYSEHDMPASVCKWCKESHHWVICVYDLLAAFNMIPAMDAIFENKTKKE